MANWKAQATLDPEQRLLLTQLIAERGLRPFAKVLGVHPQTLAVAAAGIPANRSTVALIQFHLLTDLIPPGP